MKSILVIDMPKSCEDCELCRDGYLCLRLGEVNESVENGIKDLRCPLRPIPKKEDIYERIYQAYRYGNDETYQRIRQAVEDIYDEVLGEEE